MRYTNAAIYHKGGEFCAINDHNILCDLACKFVSISSKIRSRNKIPFLSSLPASAPKKACNSGCPTEPASA